MNKDKIKACDLAYELIQVLNEIDDEDFVDKIAQSVQYAEDYSIIELKDGLLEV